MAIEIVDVPIKNGDFPISFLYVHLKDPSMNDVYMISMDLIYRK